MLLLSSFLFYDVTFYGWAPWDCYWAEVDRWRCQPDMRTNTYNSYNLDLSSNPRKVSQLPAKASTRAFSSLKDVMLCIAGQSPRARHLSGGEARCQD